MSREQYFKKLLLINVITASNYLYFTVCHELVQFKLADIGEGIREVQLKEWYVIKLIKQWNFISMICVQFLYNYKVKYWDIRFVNPWICSGMSIFPGLRFMTTSCFLIQMIFNIVIPMNYFKKHVILQFHAPPMTVEGIMFSGLFDKFSSVHLLVLPLQFKFLVKPPGSF